MTQEPIKTTQSMTAIADRRDFLENLSRSAPVVAAALGGFLATNSTQAGKPGGTKMCCTYVSRNLPVFYYRCVNGNKCPKSWRGARLYAASEVSDCSYC